MKSKLEIAVAAMQPCPMCGTTPIEDGKSDYLRIRCEGCDMQGPSFDFDGDDDDDIERASGEAAAHWNRRAAIQAQPDAAAGGDAKDAAYWRVFKRALRTGRLDGAAHGRRFKIVEISPTYGDEEEFNDFIAAIQAQGSDAA